MTLGLEDIKPPANVRWLVQLVGRDAAMRLVEVHGGIELFVPKKIGPRSELVRRTQLDWHVLEKLAKSYGGERLKLPIARDWRIQVYRQRDGLSYSEIARKLGICTSAVYKALARNDLVTSQMELAL